MANTQTWNTGFQIWLTEAQSLENAHLVAKYFSDKGWSINAISALCGNMRNESSINPDMYSYAYEWEDNAAYGLVQWSPRSKYWDWAVDNKLPPRQGDSQLARIDYEQQQGIQWIATDEYPLSFHEFTQSMADVDWLTEAFTWNYERPSKTAGENSMDNRQGFAQKVFKELYPWNSGYRNWLTEAQSLENTHLVANYFIDKGWTPKAISALCGNMRHESSINPNMYQFGYEWEDNAGYGLVQWTPRTKYWDWALDNNLNPKQGASQLARINYEQQQGIQWIPTDEYPLSFHEFTQSMADVDWLTEAFTWNYERPNRTAGENSMADRQEFAQKTFLELDPWVTGFRFWLTEQQSLENAQLVANYLSDKGWTPNAISALCGNMRHESSINPRMYQFGYDWEDNAAYGIVQWNPRSKYWDWALDNNLTPEYGNSQVARIDYEQQQGIQWNATDEYPLSFHEFTQSMVAVEWLTEAFTWNYERPSKTVGENTMPDRKAFAKKVLKQLGYSTGGGTFPTEPVTIPEALRIMLARNTNMRKDFRRR